MRTHKPQTILSLSLLVLFICTALPAQDWQKLEEEVAIDPHTYDAFGYSVAITGPDDNGELYAIVGDPFDDEDPYSGDPLNEAGSALILRKAPWDSEWMFDRKIGTTDRGAGHHFGKSVSISGDNCIVGADNGWAYVFSDFSGSFEWVALAARDTATGGTLSSAVSISGDYAAVGGGPGAVYIFHRNTPNWDMWGQVKKITMPGGTFGASISISNDMVLVGDPTFNLDSAGENDMTNAGAAYLFQKDQGGSGNWGLVKMFVAGDRGTEKMFGNAVALSDSAAAIASYNDYHDENGSDSIHNAGSVYIFKEDQWGTGKWGQLKKLLADDREAEDLYGTSISLSDGYLTVGLPKDIDGEAYVYWENKGGQDNWGKISVLSPEVSVSESFGSSVAVTKGGIIVGSPSHGTSTGKVTIYENCQSTTLDLNMNYDPDLGFYLQMQWEEGKGDARVIFMKNGELDGTSPSDSTTFLADTVFGQGDQIGTSGWYCVYNSYYDQVSVTGLGPGTYQIKVLDYYGAPGTERYITGPAYWNPKPFKYGNDLSGITVNVAKKHLYHTYDTLQFSNTSTDGMDGSWIGCDEDSTYWDFHPGKVWVRENYHVWNSRMLLEIPERVEPPEYTINYLESVYNV
jgi:hypothetical protein